MTAWPGPPPPPPPPAPPGTVYPCNPLPDTLTGACPEGTIRAEVELSTPERSLGNATQPTHVECMSLPHYNVFTQKFAFSTCFQWACFPPAFHVREREQLPATRSPSSIFTLFFILLLDL